MSSPHDTASPGGFRGNEGRESAYGLCSECKTLDLREDQFLLGSAKPKSPYYAARSTYRRTPTAPPANSHFTSGNGQLDLSNLEAIKKRRGDCGVCDAICRAVSRYSGQKALTTVPLKLAWELDGRSADEFNILEHRTRRIRISWDEIDGRRESFCFILAGYSSGALNDCAFLGREMVTPQEKLDMMNSWIKDCAEQHSPNCSDDIGRKAEFERLVRATYFGVIDVVDMQLKPLPGAKDGTGNTADYVALSYDAILLVREIGQRYLWVDSLCIVQDSTSSWELNAKSMHLVYGNAHFTICAADGDATTGLRAVSAILSEVRNYGNRESSFTQTQSPVSSYQTTQDTSVGFPIENHERYDPLIIEHPIRLLVSRSPEDVIQGSSWDKRGWTFQERLLSRRCLIFAENLVYFQCRSAVMSQDKYSDLSQRGWSLDYATSPLRTLGQLKKKAFWFYMKCVGLYTGRHLTKPKDILTAFQGSSWLLEQHLQAPLLYGLPRSHFDLSVLWTPVSTLCRRKKAVQRDHFSPGTPTRWQYHFTCDQCSSLENDVGVTEFPSWSWCGWMDGKCEYESGMLDGCFPDVQEWLTYHTWIQWYVRDRDGNLRPLWNRNLLKEDISQDSRWRGYPGHDTPPRFPIRNFGDPAHTSYQKSGSDTRHYPEPIDAQPSPRDSQDAGAVPARLRGRPADMYKSALPKEEKWKRHSAESYVKDLQPYNPGVPGAEEAQSGPSRIHQGRASEDSRLDSPLRCRVRQRDQGAPGTDYPGHHLPLEPEPSSPPPPVPQPPSGTMPMHSDDESDTRLGANRRASIKLPEGDQMIWTRNASMTSSLVTRTYDTPDVDDYGRPIRPAAKCGTDFTGILPDNPFGVHCGPFSSVSGFGDAETMPVLQFWTYWKELYVTIQEPQSSTRNDNCVRQCDIRDSSDAVCGVIKLPRTYIETRLGKELFFVALSDAKGFTAEEFPVWNYYITKAREDSEWDLYFVLLLERNNERALWERVGLGKVFKAAFKGSVWREIKLG